MNPKFAFYSALLRLLQSVPLDRNIAKEMVHIYKSHPGAIGPAAVSVERIGLWLSLIKAGALPELLGFAFKDLAPQMRNARVRELFFALKAISGVEQTLYVQAVSSKFLGDGMGVYSLLSDNKVEFKDYLEQPLRFLRYDRKVQVSL